MNIAHTSRPLVFLIAIASLVPASWAQTSLVTPKRPVTNQYADITVSDPYQWLEDTESLEVKQWAAAQNAMARSTLDAIPLRASLKKEIAAMQGGARVSRRDFRFVAEHLFALKNAPPKNQSMLVTLNARGDPASERVVVDPNLLDPSGDTEIDWYQPSLDGSMVAVSLSKGGSEDGTLYVFDTRTGRRLPDVVPRVQYPTGGGSVAWVADHRGFFYTRYPAEGERAKEDARYYQQIYFHQLGTASSMDRYAFGDAFPRIAETTLQSSEDGRFIVADVANGDGGEHAIYLRGQDDAWIGLAGDADGIRNISFGRDRRLYAVRVRGAPRGELVALDLASAARGFAAAQLIVPESKDVIEEYTATEHRLYIGYLQGGPSTIEMFGLDGAALGPLGDIEIASVDIGVRLHGDAILFGSQSYTRAFAWFSFDPARPRAAPVALRLTDAPVYAVDGGLPGATAVREFATSKDGTRIPVTLVYCKDAVLDGRLPALLTAYGGFDVSITPNFSRFVALWLRHGGVYAEANLRGGGEFGEDWHKAGALTSKQNVFDDFAAASRLLIERGYTSPAHLAIEGGSNGGLLMGAALVQHPELYRAVVSEVGIYDMMRLELTPNGAFNTTEYGSVTDAAQREALYAYSPYHHVRDGSSYPAVLLTTGAHDGRVAPWMSFKMAARLQAANASGQPVLLRVDADQGHGIGTSLATSINQDADVDAFLFEQLGMH